MTYFSQLILPERIDFELNAFSEQGWTLYKLFQEPGPDRGLVRYRGIWQREEAGAAQSASKVMP